MPRGGGRERKGGEGGGGGGKGERKWGKQVQEGKCLVSFAQKNCCLAENNAESFAEDYCQIVLFRLEINLFPS